MKFLGSEYGDFGGRGSGRDLVAGAGEQSSSHVIGVTSAVHQEGVSTIARRLALGLCKGDGRVMLVKATASNAARETAGPRAASSNAGIDDVWNGLATVDDVSGQCGESGLKELTANALWRGGQQPLRQSGWMSLLDLLRAQYLWVVVDLPPVQDGVDALRSARALDGVVMVVRANKTRGPVVSRAYRAMVRSRILVRGVVLNRYEHVIPDWAYSRL